MQEIKNRIQKEEVPDEIFITSSMTFHAKSIAEIINICKEIFPKTKITLGGIYASLCPEHAKQNTKADIIYKGIFKEAENYNSDISLLDYKPNYHVFKSTRGCPFNCSYCAVHKLEGNKMCYRNPEDVLKEIFEVNDKYGIKIFKAWESNILVNFKTHFEKILDGILDSGRDLILEVPEGISPQLMTKELAEKYLDVAGNIILALDPDGTITLLNKKGHEIMGYKKGELIGKNWIDLFIPKESLNDIKKVHMTNVEKKDEFLEYCFCQESCGEYS